MFTFGDIMTNTNWIQQHHKIDAEFDEQMKQFPSTILFYTPEGQETFKAIQRMEGKREVAHYMLNKEYEAQLAAVPLTKQEQQAKGFQEAYPEFCATAIETSTFLSQHWFTILIVVAVVGLCFGWFGYDYSHVGGADTP
jgi:hypothetical protein